MGRTPWVPAWVGNLGTAAWVCGQDHIIRFFNRRAEALLAKRSEECLGRPCFEVVAGKTASNRAFCGPRCPLYAAALRDGVIEPFAACVHTPRGTRWLELVGIPVRRDPDSPPVLVHCALDLDRSHRMEAFLHHVATRTPPADGEAAHAHRLTPREKEVLRLLAEDWTLPAISDHLCVSYATVRNHVQHILDKLGAHSTLEAVAQYLLDGQETHPGA